MRRHGIEFASRSQEELACMDLDEIEEMLVVLKRAADVRDRVLNDWEREFIESVNRQYDQRVASGFTSPLTLKQLTRLDILYGKLAVATAAVIKGM